MSAEVSAERFRWRIRLFMLIALVGLAAGVVAAVIGAWAVLRARRPRQSRLELVDVSLPPVGRETSTSGGYACVFDVKVRNTGGQPAVIKRLVVHSRRAARFYRRETLWPYLDLRFISGGAVLSSSETYEVTLPEPEQAAGARIAVDLSQVVEPGGADRFLIRAGCHPTAVYLLHLEVLYDADDRKVISPALAVAVPDGGHVYTADEIRHDLRRFQVEIRKVRTAIDSELAARGLPRPDWFTAPPRRLSDLPGGLRSVVELEPHRLQSVPDPHSGVYLVNENFWDPLRAIEKLLRAVETAYCELAEVVTPAATMHDTLRAALTQIHATLKQLPALRAEFCGPKNAITAPDDPTN